MFAVREYHMPMMLKPQDVVVLLKLVVLDDAPWTFHALAGELFISPSEVHAGVRRATTARLISPGESGRPQPVRAALLEFLVHGVRYAYPAERGGLARGVPTGHAAPPLNSAIVAGDEPPPVWPFAEGMVRGYSLAPLYRTVPEAALRDPALHEYLALVDGIRDGRARERRLAAEMLEARLTAVAV